MTHQQDIGRASATAGARQDRRAELLLRTLAAGVLALIAAMIWFVFREGWESFAQNGLAWFGSGGNVDAQLFEIYRSGELGTEPVYHIRMWPILWGSILLTTMSTLVAFVVSTFVSVFIVEFAPEWMRRMLEPVIRLLASMPSVVIGLVGVLVVVPFIAQDLISDEQRRSVSYIVQLNGFSMLAGIVLLSLMIMPLMITIFVDGLRAVPKGWIEGSLGLGINRWRTWWKIGVRTARPALVAGTVLATARALGEVVMLAMVTGGVGFAPNPADGLIFFFEPAKPLPATIVQSVENIGSPPMRATIFAMASLLLFSALTLSFAGWLAKQPMKKYGARA